MCQDISPTRFKGITCPRCGYDLRGLPDRVCPECGRRFDETRMDVPRDTVLAMDAAVISVIGAIVHFVLMLPWSLEQISSWYCRGCCRAGTESLIPILVFPLLIIQGSCCAAARNGKLSRRLAINALIATATTWLTCMIITVCH